jgi:hypothetical protein
MMNFIQSHIVDIIAIMAVLGVIFLLLKAGKKKQAGRIIYGLVVQAEKLLGSKTGQAKFAVVYTKLPWVVRLLYTQTEIEKMVEDAVGWLKIYLRNGKDLLGYDEENVKK